MASLSEEGLLKLCDVSTVSDIDRLDAAAKDLSSVCSLKKAKKLHRADLSKNQLQSLKFVGKCTSLTWLNVSENRIVTLAPLAELVSLQVLNASRNEVSSLDGMDKLTELKALILNNNGLTSLPSLSSFRKLNTLILSHNLLTSLDPSYLPLLEKLQLSHNKLQAFPGIKKNHLLKAVSVNENAIVKIPAGILGEANTRLEIVELGKNKIEKLRSIKELHILPNLKRLNLRGNPVTAKDNYATKVKIICPYLTNLDGRPVGSVPAKVPSVKKAAGSDAEHQTVNSGDEAANVKEPSGVAKRKTKKRSHDSSAVEATLVNDMEAVVPAKKAKKEKEDKKTKKKKKGPGEASDVAESGVVAVKVIKKMRGRFDAAVQLSQLDHTDFGCGGGLESW